MPSAVLRTKLGQRVLDLGGGAAGQATGAFVAQTDNEGARATYGAFQQSIVPAATPTDIFHIRGSATKLIRVKSIYISGTATAASNIFCYLVRRSAQNTGGTFVPVTPMRHDITDDPVAATIGYYTANPSALGTALGTAHGGRLNIAPAANGSIDRLLFDFGWRNEKAIILNGANDILAVNLGGAAWPAGGNLDVDCCWVEEDLEPTL